MMNCIIGIGGTGAKCVEATVRLASAGLLPRQDLTAIFVDPDRANGSLGRAQEAVRTYAECRTFLGPRNAGDAGMLATRITASNPEVWTPFETRLNPTLESFFNYSQLVTQDRGAAMLMDTLYDPQEKSAVLDKGFLGHPAIGAAVLAERFTMDAEPWKTLEQQIKAAASQTRKPRVLLVGSIFGGTGASGLPTIARLLRGALPPEVEIAAILALPYFKFDEIDGEGMVARSNEFLQNTQAALKYYAHHRFDSHLDAVYVLGNHQQDSVTNPVRKPQKGGREQINAPHFVELYAALAAADFFGDSFTREPAGAPNARYRLVARRGTNGVNWNDLPAPGGDPEELKRGIEQFTRFAFAYRTLFYPAITDVRDHGRAYRAPWYVNFFKRHGATLRDERERKQLEAAGRLCDGFLLWLANVQASTGARPTGKDYAGILADYRSFASGNDRDENLALRAPEHMDAGQFSRLFASPNPTAPGSLGRLWEEMSDARTNSYVKDDAISQFLRALHERCR